MQDSETYLNQLDLELSCAVEPNRPAIVDGEHRYTVGYETFFVCDGDALARLKADPDLLGWITDPVSKRRFRPDRSSPRSEFEGRPYLFEDAANQVTFEKDPAAHAHPKFGMLPMGE